MWKEGQLQSEYSARPEHQGKGLLCGKRANCNQNTQPGQSTKGRGLHKPAASFFIDKHRHDQSTAGAGARMQLGIQGLPACGLCTRV
jgi:hypothetical protein